MNEQPTETGNELTRFMKILKNSGNKELLYEFGNLMKEWLNRLRKEESMFYLEITEKPLTKEMIDIKIHRFLERRSIMLMAELSGIIFDLYFNVSCGDKK